MKISIAYNEISELVSNNTGKNVKFEYGGCKEEIVARIIGVPVRIRILQVESHSVTVLYGIGGDATMPLSGIMMDSCPSAISMIGGLFKRGAQVAGNKAINVLVEKFVKHPSVSVNEDKSVTIDLEKIPQMKATMAVVSLNSVSFDEDGAIADMAIK